jgi:hypothetical protein
MGNLKDGLRGLFLAAVVVGFFLVVTMMALAWFLRPRRVAQ